MTYFLLFIIILNVTAFTAFGIDKYLAIHNKQRIREKSLLYLAIGGGSIGSIAGQKIFRHKIQKFKGVLWIILLTHTIIFLAVFLQGYM